MADTDAALYTELQALLKPFGQEHVLTFWDRLDSAQRAALADDVRSVDLADQQHQFNRAMLSASRPQPYRVPKTESHAHRVPFA